MSTIIDVKKHLTELFGMSCASLDVGEYKSLNAKFGQKIPRPNRKNPGAYTYEWEVGTYDAAWRIISKEGLIFGITEPTSDSYDLYFRVHSIEVGSLIDIEMISSYDLRLIFSTGTVIEFMCASTQEEILQIFGPERFFCSYRQKDGWLIKNLSYESNLH